MEEIARYFEEIARRLEDMASRLDQLEATSAISYAKGTYVPTYLGGATAGVTTYSTQQGEYTRIGRMVVASGAVVWTAATGTGNARISLPFTAAAGINFSGSVRLVSVTFANSSPEPEFASTAYFEMRSPLTNGAGTVVAVEAAGNIIFTIVYFV